jgi:hypothetical protein
MEIEIFYSVNCLGMLVRWTIMPDESYGEYVIGCVYNGNDVILLVEGKFKKL